jgi:glycosyltransferase involved in cell wall biosynthesis
MTRVLMAEATDFRTEMQVGSHALARQFLSFGAHVMWIGTPLYPHTFMRARDATTTRRVEVWRRGGVTRDGLTEYYPFTALPALNRPLLNTKFAAQQTLRATCPPLSHVIKRHGFLDPDVLWLSASRFSYPLLSVVRARRSAYRMSDDWAAFPEVPRALIELEARIIKRVDAVFVTGRVLEARVRQERPDVVYLPNGVDEVFFASPRAEDEALARFPHPRVVFAGTLGDWIDYDAVRETAQRNQNASVLLVGAGASARGKHLPANVRVMGAVPYDRLPAVLHACDVGIVPFLRTPRTEAASSNKVFQYLACGLPVVASRTSEFDQANAPVSLCDDAASFAEAVGNAIAQGTSGREGRIAFARLHTWSRRAEAVRRALEF